MHFINKKLLNKFQEIFHNLLLYYNLFIRYIHLSAATSEPATIIVCGIRNEPINVPKINWLPISPQIGDHTKLFNFVIAQFDCFWSTFVFWTDWYKMLWGIWHIDYCAFKNCWTYRCFYIVLIWKLQSLYKLKIPVSCRVLM